MSIVICMNCKHGNHLPSVLATAADCSMRSVHA